MKRTNYPSFESNTRNDNKTTSKGWIKTHREILEWEWFDDAEVYRFFQYLILKANYEDKSWKGIIVPKGSLLTGRKQLSRDLNRSERQIRTLLDKLKSTNEIAISSTNKYSIITICKYDIYQGGEDEESPTNRPTKSPISDQQKVQSATTTKEIKKEEEKYKKENNLPAVVIPAVFDIPLCLLFNNK